MESSGLSASIPASTKHPNLGPMAPADTSHDPSPRVPATKLVADSYILQRDLGQLTAAYMIFVQVSRPEEAITSPASHAKVHRHRRKACHPPNTIAGFCRPLARQPRRSCREGGLGTCVGLRNGTTEGSLRTAAFHRGDQRQGIPTHGTPVDPITTHRLDVV
jgi:hypothetical protein